MKTKKEGGAANVSPKPKIVRTVKPAPIAVEEPPVSKKKATAGKVSPPKGAKIAYLDIPEPEPPDNVTALEEVEDKVRSWKLLPPIDNKIRVDSEVLAVAIAVANALGLDSGRQVIEAVFRSQLQNWLNSYNAVQIPQAE